MPAGAERKRIVILGSTGSIGTSCLDVVRAHSERFEITALAANSRWEQLAEQCREFRPRRAILAGIDPQAVSRDAFPRDVELLFGPQSVAAAAREVDVDVVVAAIVGAAGLEGTWAALAAGKRVALANKETFVVAGPLVTELAARTGAQIIPVDSEHSAVFQSLQAGRRCDLERIILTASGGPFRTWSKEQLESATVADALAHPTWNMGKKITIDSATMMNKALEIVEARWLFDLRPDQIDVVIHAQSIVHSLLEFVDGSVIAQLSPPDMRLPIQYALFYPERVAAVSPRMDFMQTVRLDFHPPDFDRFPALELGFEVAARGGTAGAVLNAANEVAVERFLAGELAFTEVPRLCRSILDSHQFEATPSLEEVLQQDAWARQEAFRWQSSNSPCCQRASLISPRSSTF